MVLCVKQTSGKRRSLEVGTVAYPETRHRDPSSESFVKYLGVISSQIHLKYLFIADCFNAETEISSLFLVFLFPVDFAWIHATLPPSAHADVRTFAITDV